MYQVILYTHSWLRWVLLLLAIYVIAKSIIGWSGNKNFTTRDDLLSILLISLFHTQLVLGLLLYFFYSPITLPAFSDFGAAMKNSYVRYWAVEHIFIMILSVVIAQVGRIMIKRSHSDRGKFRNSVIYFLLALILILSRIPWTDSARFFRGLL